MKWLVGLLAALGGTCVLGCGTPEISHEGKYVHVVRCKPHKDAPPSAVKQSVAVIPTLPSRAPSMVRFEWGRTEVEGSPEAYCFLATFEAPETVHDRDYQQALEELRGVAEPDRPYVRTLSVSTEAYLFHDATPQVQDTTHRHLRRVVMVRLRSDVTREDLQKFEDAIAALPQEIPAIKRLEWGEVVRHDPRNPKPTDSASIYEECCLLFTFNGASDRDKCLAHPVYQEFEDVLDKYVFRWANQTASLHAWEYVADVEYIARKD